MFLFLIISLVFSLNSFEITPPIVESFDVDTIKLKIKEKGKTDDLSFILAVSYIENEKFDLAYEILKDLKPLKDIEDYFLFYKSLSIYKNFDDYEKLTLARDGFYKLIFTESKNIVEKVNEVLPDCEYKLSLALIKKGLYRLSLDNIIKAKSRGFHDFEKEFKLYKMYLNYDEDIAVSYILSLQDLVSKEEFIKNIKTLKRSVYLKLSFLTKKDKKKLTKEEEFIKEEERKFFSKIKESLKKNDISTFKNLSSVYLNVYRSGYFKSNYENITDSFIKKSIERNNFNINTFKYVLINLNYNFLNRMKSYFWKKSMWNEAIYILDIMSRKYYYDPKIMFLSASIYEDKKDYVKAKEGYLKLVKAFPKSDIYYRRAFFKLAWLNILQKNYARASHLFSSYLKEAKGDLNWDITAALFFKYKCLNKINKKSLANNVKDYLYKKYPYSFYALVLKEENGVNLKKEIEEDIKKINIETVGSISPHEAFYLNKAKKLIHLGLLEDAAKELSNVETKGISTYYLNLVISLYKYSSYPNMAVRNSYDLLRKYKGYISKEHIKNHFPILYSDIVKRYAEKYNLDPYLVFSIIKRESAFKKDAVSAVKAYGLMQLMPFVAKSLDKSLKKEDLKNARKNISLGTKHFKEVLKKTDGDIVYSLASYNAGINPIRNWIKWYSDLNKIKFIENIPYAETRDYVKNILANYYMYKAIYDDKNVKLIGTVFKKGDLDI